MSQNPQENPEYNMVASGPVNPPASNLPVEQLGNMSLGGNSSSAAAPVMASTLTAEEVIIRSFESFSQEERAAALAYLSSTYNLRERSPQMGNQELRNVNHFGVTSNPPVSGTRTNASPYNNYPIINQTGDFGQSPHGNPPASAVSHHNNVPHAPGTTNGGNMVSGHVSGFTNRQQNYPNQGPTQSHPSFRQMTDHMHSYPVTGSAYTGQNAINQSYYNDEERQNRNYNTPAQTNGQSHTLGLHTETPVLHRVSLKFPEPRGFDGSRDQQKVEEFIYQVERYTKFYGLTGPRAVETGSGYFKGKATTWWRLYTRHNSAPEDIGSFGELLRDKFIPKTAKRNLKDKMEKLKQYGSVAKFNSEFRDMLLELPDLYMNEDDLIHKYLSKLKGKTRVEVEWKITNEDNLESVMDLAERYDNIIYSQGTTTFVRTRNNGPTTISNDPMDIDNSQLNKLTDQQREFLVKNKGCFKCRKIGHFSKDCKVKFGLNNISTNTDESHEESIEEEYERLFGEPIDELENSDEAPSS